MSLAPKRMLCVLSLFFLLPLVSIASYVDSLQIILDQQLSKNNFSKAQQILLELGNIQSENQNLDQALVHFQQALSFSEQMENPNAIMSVLFKIGSIHKMQDQKGEALTCFFPDVGYGR